jgi:hypothetical protein
MIKFKWWRALHVMMGYKSFYKGWPVTTRVLIRGNMKGLVDHMLGDGYIEEWGPSER